MLEWMILPFKRYAEFSGRSRRKEYWSFALLMAVVYAVLLAIVFSSVPWASLASPENAGNPLAMYSIFASGLGLLVLVWWLATLIPNLAVTVRRLHDRDMSGWWVLGLIVASMVPFVGFIASIALLVLMFLPGTPGPNRFGPDPKDPASAEVFS